MVVVVVVVVVEELWMCACDKRKMGESEARSTIQGDTRQK